MKLMILFQRVKRNRHLMKYYLESFYYLFCCKIMIVVLPHRWWSLQSCHFQCETLKENVAVNNAEILALQRAIKFVARLVPWRSQCLDQALAMQHMLTRRNLQSTLYLGMIKNADKSWSAHAWVRCGDQWMVGYHADRSYTVVGTYAKFFNGSL